jgi:iron complex outermembrane recepter protein
LGRRITELGPRAADFETTLFQYTLGVRGEIAANWKYDAYWSRGESDQIQTRGNWGSDSKVQQALRALNPTSCTDPSNGCVPINLFGPEGSITPAMLKFIDEDALLRQIVQQDVASGSVTGDLGDTVKSPWATRAIGLAFGTEYRAVDGRTKSDAASQIQGEVLGTGAPTPDRSGKLRLREVYTEGLVPIVDAQPFVHALTAELGYRHTDFTAADSEEYGTYKYGGEWAPLQELRFRAMEEHATRAPNINELFQPLSSGLSNLSVDPCQGNRINPAQANVAGTLANLCRLTGVPLAAIGSLPAPSAGQINDLLGGNPNLHAEKADTTTIGLVWQPEYVEGLTASLDYYRIKINQAITSPSVTDVLNQCYSPTFNPGLTLNAACALVQRSPITGTFNGADAKGVVTSSSNAGTLETYGYDLSLKYSLGLPRPGWGRLSFTFDGNDTQSWKFQANASSVDRQCAGLYSVACSSVSPSTWPDLRPRYKWTQRTIWTVSDFDFSYQWRHLSAVHAEASGFLPQFSRIPNFEYFDLAADWQATQMLRVNFTINNLMNKQPPIVGSTIGSTAYNSGNTFPSFYDTVGRYFTLAVALHF